MTYDMEFLPKLASNVEKNYSQPVSTTDVSLTIHAIGAANFEICQKFMVNLQKTDCGNELIETGVADDTVLMLVAGGTLCQIVKLCRKKLRRRNVSSNSETEIQWFLKIVTAR